MERRPHRWRRYLVATVIVGALVAGGLAVAVATGLILEDTATPVSIQDVVQRFRELKRQGGKLDGVYLYRTRGGESVDALGGAHHRYPAKTTITAIEVPCGLRLEWQPLVERSATWTFCATGLGIELLSWEVRHRFFGQGDRTSYDCVGSVLVPAAESAGTTSAFRCRSNHGRQTGKARVLGFQQIAVAGTPVRVLHVRTVAHVSGGDQGTETVDWWLDAQRALPVRIELEGRTSRPLFLGEVHYREDADLRLLSTTPLR